MRCDTAFLGEWLPIFRRTLCLHLPGLKVQVILLLLSVGLPVANALDVLQPCGLLYYP